MKKAMNGYTACKIGRHFMKQHSLALQHMVTIPEANIHVYPMQEN